MPRARRRSDAWVATGLAIGTCAGVAGLIAVRAAETPPDENKRAELDSYAEQLTTEAARLQAYRRELRRVAAELSQGEKADLDVARRIAEETRPPGSTDPPNRLDRDTATYSS